MTWNNDLKILKRILHPAKLQIWHCLIGKVSKSLTLTYFFLKKYWRCDLLKRNKKPNKTTRDTKEVRWEGITSVVKDRCAPDIESNIQIGAMWFRLHSSTDGYNDQDAYYLPLKQNKTQQITDCQCLSGLGFYLYLTQLNPAFLTKLLFSPLCPSPETALSFTPSEFSFNLHFKQHTKHFTTTNHSPNWRFFAWPTQPAR